MKLIAMQKKIGDIIFKSHLYITIKTMKIIKTIDADIELSVKEIADMFCAMDEKEQCHFFNAIAENVKGWDVAFVFQLQAMVDRNLLTSEAKTIMREIGNYSQE